MEISNGAYQPLDPKRVNRPSSNKSEDADDIEVCLKTVYSQQKQECSQHSGPWKSIAMCLGLVCTLSLCGIAVLTFNLSETKISHDNLRKEHSQSHTNYSKLTSEKAQLEESYDHLSAECNTVKSEKSRLQISNQNLERQQSLLQESYNSLNEEKSQLQNRLDGTAMEKNKLLRRFCKARVNVTKHAAEVTLDPETACNYLTLSANGKQVVRQNTAQPVPDSGKRFLYYAIQGTQGFSSGRFYFEVQVSDCKNWELGMVRESITKREEQSSRNSTNGYWIIKRTVGLYRPASISPNVDLEIVGVFVDYEGGLVSFYDADTWTLMYSFKNVSFKKKIYPYIFAGDPCPLTISTPVSCVN